ncbi:alpha-glucuronidase [Paenibacillus sambharensis]|uniref:Xylan alpha-1,2-glucuronidase n=1 Tax=Paenibacillus sambharensis TaxID=1803190 RepID=A0A2W1LRM7_9BACL|nr:alpha-glucuronidase family glycosyl hydrolase [Paenibacillus sambharensis]PZD94481.1 alpha-glucuronidase [Paenibacillus sambharensis]
MTVTGLGYKAWLGGGDAGTAARLTAERYRSWLKRIAVTGAATGYGPLETAVQELVNGLEALLGWQPSIVAETEQAGGCVLVGTAGSSSVIDEVLADGVRAEGYRIRTRSGDKDQPCIIVAGGDERGALYGVFHLLRLLRTGADLASLNIMENPACRLRMINHWDNMDGSIERGYAGRSIFFRDGEVLADSKRITDYARLMASVGINGIAINNVNVHELETLLITERYLPQVARIADVFRAYGITLYLSINYSSPMQLGGLPTADPLDESVRAWWRSKMTDIYHHIPDFGGVVVKADSENRPGPFTYGRDHADGANMLAEALEPFGGLVLWRCFVYNCHQDWRDRSTDRARAAYDHFKPLDGRFKDNVILQIKNGPMDFQVREPVSPLIGAMERTNQMVEFQITQEYTGQQRDVCYLVPQWKGVLDFDTRCSGEGSTVKRIAAGEVHPYRYSGITAVTSIGDDSNWTGHHLAAANLYGYGRLIWNPELSAEEIASEWLMMTFGVSEEDPAGAVITRILHESWHTYEHYTAPLGVGWMVTPHYHYGVDVDGYEYSKWGTYHFADRDGIGVDRTQATGTGYTAQYRPEVGQRYEQLESCPDELLLFFHHVPYTHVLKSGKTVIQHIYDTHFAGVEQVEKWIGDWRQLEGQVDAERHAQISERLQMQLDNARQWRDVINTYFYRKSGIPDEHGRLIY